jgi:hypothetical protein
VRGSCSRQMAKTKAGFLRIQKAGLVHSVLC